MTPGRSFFICIEVNHTSNAPSPKSLSLAYPSVSPEESSILVSNNTLPDFVTNDSELISPNHTLTIFAKLSGSLPPNPTPISETENSGLTKVANPVIIAAPVGVVSSPMLS